MSPGRKKEGRYWKILIASTQENNRTQNLSPASEDFRIKAVETFLFKYPASFLFSIPSSKPAVPKLIGTRDQFSEKQFCHELGLGERFWGDS